MRNGVNMLLPKYYIPINIPAHNLTENPLLMMELLPDGTLNDFKRNHKNNVSLLAKIKILFSITMGLRYLETYRIVHLDIKPSNIMMAPDLLVKIIDFGEAYHPAVCKEEGANYRPGFTPPYSPPEIYSRGKMEFTSKSDVYSLGVVMFEVLYGKVPFESRERMFLAPEVSDIYGDPVVIRILNWVISRCLSHNPECRP